MDVLASTDLDRLLRRARGEYRDNPDLGLTLAQARRFFDIDEASCARLLDHLVDTGFLTRTATGLFRRNAAASKR